MINKTGNVNDITNSENEKSKKQRKNIKVNELEAI